jgi:hypothetical protein
VANSVGPPSDAGQEGHFPGPPGQPPAAATPPAKLRPARAWYWVALVVFLAGVGWVGGGVYLVAERVDSFQRVPLPGEGEVSLDHSGGYVIYYEGPGAETGNIPDFTVNVTPRSASAAVQGLEHYESSVIYSFGSREGRAVFTLQVASPGTFLIEATGGPATSGDSSLAIGSSIAGRIVGILVPSAVLMVVAVGGAIAIAIVRRRRRRSTTDYPPPPSGGYPPAPPPVEGPPSEPEWKRKARRREVFAAIGVGAVLLVAIIAAGVAGGDTDAGTTAGVPATTEEPATTEAAEPDPETTDAPAVTTSAVPVPAGPTTVAMGQSIDVVIDAEFEQGKTYATVTLANPTTAEVEPGEFGMEPTNGLFLVVDANVAVLANSQGTFAIADFDFTFVGGDGSVYEVGFATEFGPTLDAELLTLDAKLSAGQKASGKLVFDIPHDKLAGGKVQLVDTYEDYGEPLAFWTL